MRRGRARLRLPRRPLGEGATRFREVHRPGAEGCGPAQEEARVCSTTTTSAPRTSCSAMIGEGEGVGAKALESLGISLEAVRPATSGRSPARASGHPPGTSPFTPRGQECLELSLREALQLGHNYNRHRAHPARLIREGEGVAAQVLVKLGGDPSRVRQQVIQLLAGSPGQGAGRRQARRLIRRNPPIRSYWTSSAEPDRCRSRGQARSRDRPGEGNLSGFMQVLSRRTKNTPCWWVEPGVGKTAVVEGLAQRSSRARCRRPSRTSSSTPWT